MSSKIRKINKVSFNKQLILPLSFKSVKNRENFIISSSNESAVKLVENFNYWQKNTISAAIIFGPKGSGKTHLSSIFGDNNNSIYLESLSSFNLDAIKKGNVYVVDNFHPCKFYPSELVMHFFNRVLNFDGSILFLSRFSPHDMNWDLEDLNSRIRSIISSEINEPDDVLLYSFMVKYSNDKKLFLSDNHIFYILERVERSFENIIKIIDKLDAYTLEIKEKVNYKIIRTIFEN
jgi:chromosomal replication initiation ATPase DnaA